MHGFYSRILVYIGKCLLFALLYYIAGRAGRAIDFSQEGFRVLLPQSGVALAGLLVLGVRCWPAVALGSLLVTRFSTVSVSVYMSIGLAVANTLSAVGGAWMLKRFGDFDLRMRRLHDVYGFLLFGVLLAPVISATVAVAILAPEQSTGAAFLWGLWWRRCFGHGISNLVLCPFLLSWWRPLVIRWTPNRVLEGAFLLSALLLVSQGVFTGRSALPILTYPLSFVPFPLMIWAGLRFGLRGATIATMTVAVIAVYGLSRGQGPFLLLAPAHPLIVLQVYIMAVAISALFLAVAIAERQAGEIELLIIQEQLRALSARVEASREEERARISREVHDELGQVLTGLKMGLHSLLKKLPKEDAELQRKGAMLTRLNDEAVQAVRRIATDLRPGILDDLGLEESLQWLVRDFEERTGIRAMFSGPLNGRPLKREQGTALFRIAQEALTNIARHAQAQTVTVTLENRNNWLELTVEDDGVGLPSDAPHTGALGLVGMRERATLLGGSADVERRGEESRGTRVRARLPV